MTYRKTWFSYVLWVVYTMLCVIFLVFAGNYVCESYFADSLARIGNVKIPFQEHALKIFGVLTVLAVAAVYWIVRGVSGQIRKKYTVKESTCRIVECVVVLAVLAAGIFLRVQDYIQLQNTPESELRACVNGIEYFDRAVVTEQGGIEPLAYGGAYFYVLCLSFVLSFLGNKVVSAILFQVILQTAGLVLVYLVTRKAAGRIPACMVMLYLACSPGCLEMLRILGPECLFFVLYLLGMLAVVSLVKGFCDNRLKRIPTFAGAALTGLLIGVLGYLDLTALTALLVMTAIFTGRKKLSEAVPARHQAGFGAAVTLTVLSACAAGVCGTAGVVSVCRGTGFIQEIGRWAALHIENTGTFGFRPLYPYSLDMLLFGALAALASFLVFEFFRSGREQNYMLWILFCIAVAPTPLAVFGVQPFGLISMYVWGVLAGLGLQNCIFGGRAKMIQRMIEEINQAAEAAERAEENESNREIEKTEENEPIEGIEKAEEIELIEEIEKAEESESIEETEKAGENESIEEIDKVEENEPIEAAEKAAEKAEENESIRETERAEENEPIEASEKTEEDEPIEEAEKAEEDEWIEESEDPAEDKHVAEPDGPEEHEQIKETDKPEETELPAPKPRFLENPLPLPKKHVHRQMDYQYTVEEHEMKFDVEIKEGDDFDI